MKHVIVTDTHLGIKKGSDVYLRSNIALFDQICEYAGNNKITSIIHAGDFFDTRKSLSLKVIDVSQTIMTTLEDSFNQIYLIIGNHDVFFKNELYPTSLSIFKEHDKVKIIDDIFTLDNITMIPWLFDVNDFNYAKGKTDICIGHFDINDIQMNVSGYTSLGYSLNQSDFKNFKLVLSGHYHMPSSTGNIRYLGSPMQFTFNEMGCTTGFYVLDSETLELESIEFSHYPKHIIIKDTDSAKDFDIKDNIVKLAFTKDHGIDRNTEIIRDIGIHNPHVLKIDYYNLNDGMTDDTVDAEIQIRTKLEILFDFYEKSDLPDDIRYVILQKIVTNLYKEIKGEE